MMKKCSTCQKVKEASEFNKNRSRPDGLQQICRSCGKGRKEILGKDGLTHNQRRATTIGKDGLTSNQRQSLKKGADGLTFEQRRNKKVGSDGLSGKQRRSRNNAAHRLKKAYGITIHDFNRLLAGQNGACAICKGPGGKKGLCVDHDHNTGKVRALLCGNCNAGIGFLGDSARIAASAAEYLALHGNP